MTKQLLLAAEETLLHPEFMYPLDLTRTEDFAL